MKRRFSDTAVVSSPFVVLLALLALQWNVRADVLTPEYCDYCNCINAGGFWNVDYDYEWFEYTYDAPTQYVTPYGDKAWAATSHAVRDVYGRYCQTGPTIQADQQYPLYQENTDAGNLICDLDPNNAPAKVIAYGNLYALIDPEEGPTRMHCAVPPP